MKRWMKKGIAAVLACSMLLGNYGIGHAVGSRAGDGSGGNTTSLLTDAVYDEAITFENNVAFLENGHWPVVERHWDSSTGEYVIDKQETNVTAETNIVFMDVDGNKKIISNKDNDGERMFDVVFPSISALDYQMLKVLKDDKVSYIKQDGTFFGDELTYYNYAEPVTNGLILVSDDNETYRIVNSEGEVANLKISNFDSWRSVISTSSTASKIDLVVLRCDDQTVVFDGKGNYVREYSKDVEVSGCGNGYLQLKDGTKTLLIDPEGTVVRKFGPNVSLDTYYYVQYGYVEVGENKYIETEAGTEYGRITSLVNIATGETVFTERGISNFDGEIVFSSNQEYITSVANLDGTVYISDLAQYIEDLGKAEGYKSISASYTYVNESLLISLMDKEDTSKSCTFVLTKESGFEADATKKFNGIVDSVSYGGEYFMTANDERYLQNMCTIDGELVRDFGENTTYRRSWNIIKRKYPEYSYTYGSAYWAGLTGALLFLTNVYSEGQWEGYAYITPEGDVSATFRSYDQPEGNFLVTKDADDIVHVVNTSNEIVYSSESSDVKVSGFWYYDCFSVKDGGSGRCYLYDRDGKVIFGGDGIYSDIGYEGGRSGGYYGASWYYLYNNYPLSNGMCIIEKPVGDTYKYGAIVINGKKAEGLEDVIMGDVDGDGEVTADDALAILKSKAGLIVLDDNAKKAADVDGDGEITSDDALDILKKKAGLIDKFKADADV